MKYSGAESDWLEQFSSKKESTVMLRSPLIVGFEGLSKNNENNIQHKAYFLCSLMLITFDSVIAYPNACVSCLS